MYSLVMIQSILTHCYFCHKVGLFHRLMSRIVQLIGSKAELYYRQIYFPVARNHWVLVEMKPPPDAVIKVRLKGNQNIHVKLFLIQCLVCST